MTNKDKLTKEEKIEKAKKLMSELKDLELSKEELEAVYGGTDVVGIAPGVAMGKLYNTD